MLKSCSDLQIHQIPIQVSMWDVLDQQVQSTVAPPHILQDLKDLLLTSWCQIPQDTFGGLVESIPLQVGAVLQHA